MNGPIMFAFVWSGSCDASNPHEKRARFSWNGSRWRFQWMQIYDKSGAFKRVDPHTKYNHGYIRDLETAAMDAFGMPYSEKYQEWWRMNGMPLLQV